MFLGHRAQLLSFHITTAVVKDTTIPQRLEMPAFTSPKHLDPTIYPTEVGVSSVSGREGEQQMLSTAIKITLDPQRNVKVRPPNAHHFTFGRRLKLNNVVVVLCCCFFVGIPCRSSTSRCHHATLRDADQSQLA